MKYLFFLSVFSPFFLFSDLGLEEEFLWPQIKVLKEQEMLCPLVHERLQDLQCLNEKWRPFISKEQSLYSDFFSGFSDVIGKGKLVLESAGAGAAYILYDDNQIPQFVIKPTDEDIFCLNNPKFFASPFTDPTYRVKNHIPLYRSSQTEAVCYEIARVCHLDHITPQAVLSLISHSQFFQISKDRKQDSTEKEKLCSIQEYLKGTISLLPVLEEFFTLGVPEEEFLDRFDQEDFEDINFFLWLTFDNDAHAENFRVYPKKTTGDGHIIYGIQKIDNGLSFPEENSGFSNALMYFPNALLPLSEKTREQIQSIPLDEIKQILFTFDLESSFFALEQRVFVLQQLIKKENLTYYECSLRLSLLEKENGEDLALKDCAIENLEYLAKSLFRIKSWFESRPEG